MPLIPGGAGYLDLLGERCHGEGKHRQAQNRPAYAISSAKLCLIIHESVYALG